MFVLHENHSHTFIHEQRGEHCTNPIVSGPFGAVAMALKRWRRSLIRFEVRGPFREVLEHNGIDVTHVEMLRMSVWGGAFERLDNPSKIIMFHQKLVRWVKSTHKEYERRLAHTIKSLRAHVWGSARQYTFVVMGDTEIDSERHHKMVQRFKADHPCFDLFELTGRGSFDIQLKDFAPLEERPHRLPLVPTLVVLVHAYMSTFVHAHPYPQSHTLAHMHSSRSLRLAGRQKCGTH